MHNECEKVDSAKFIIDRMSDIFSYISIQGNIGSGKSKFLERLAYYFENDYLIQSNNHYDDYKRIYEKLTSIILPFIIMHYIMYYCNILSVYYATLCFVFSSFFLVTVFRNIDNSPSSIPIDRWIDDNILCYLQVEHYYQSLKKLLKRKDSFLLINEPVEEWTKVMYNTKKCNELVEEEDKYSILKLFYNDMTNNGFLFQIKAFTSRLNKIVESIGKIKTSYFTRNHILAERSLRTDRLFFSNLYESGNIKNVEWDIYNEFYSLICNEIIKKENIMIYINTSPVKCYERVLKRDRKAEKKVNKDGEEKESSGIPLEYLESLDIKHKEMIDEFGIDKKNRIITIDFEKDMNNDEIDIIIKDTVKALIRHINV